MPASRKSSESAKKHAPAKKNRASAKAAPAKKESDDQIYQQRLDRFYDEMKWLYFELYPDNPYVQMHFDDLCAEMKKYYTDRPTALKNSDKKREADPDWYKRNDLFGMMMYVNAFAGTLNGIRKKMNYIRDCGIHYRV